MSVSRYISDAIRLIVAQTANYCCEYCIATVVPSGDIVPLYNPRKHKWSEHFSIDDGFILAKTSTGEGTITLLKLNDPDRLILRRILEEAGRYPM